MNFEKNSGTFRIKLGRRMCQRGIFRDIVFSNSSLYAWIPSLDQDLNVYFKHFDVSNINTHKKDSIRAISDIWRLVCRCWPRDCVHEVQQHFNARHGVKIRCQTWHRVILALLMSCLTSFFGRHVWRLKTHKLHACLVQPSADEGAFELSKC